MNSLNKKSIRTLLIITFLTIMIIVYCVVLIQFSILFISTKSVINIIFAVGILVISILGFWVVYKTINSGIQLQKLTKEINDLGQNVDITGLEKRASGRLTKESSENLFEEIQTQWDKDPDNWITNYRVARMYDYCGDRKRAREFMKRSLSLKNN